MGAPFVATWYLLGMLLLFKEALDERILIVLMLSLGVDLDCVDE